MFFSIIGVGLTCYVLGYILLLFILDCNFELAFYEKFGKTIRSMSGMVVFITGASGGIGEYTAIALAEHGVKLVLTARRKTELERVKELCIARSKGTLSSNDILIIEMDLLNFESHESCFNLAIQHFGHVDVLFNNAGRSQRAIWENIELDVDKDLFDLNVFAVINLTRIAVKYFKLKGHGHVAVSSSFAGIIGAPFSASYTGSKHAIQGYFNCLRIEKLKSTLDLTVSIICPGPIVTKFLPESFTEKRGVKYGISGTNDEGRMTGDRCGKLIGITLANKLNEVWISPSRVLLLGYMIVYCPILANTILKVLGQSAIFKSRDS